MTIPAWLILKKSDGKTSPGVPTVIPQIKPHSQKKVDTIVITAIRLSVLRWALFFTIPN